MKKLHICVELFYCSFEKLVVAKCVNKSKVLLGCWNLLEFVWRETLHKTKNVAVDHLLVRSMSTQFVFSLNISKQKSKFHQHLHHLFKAST